MNNKETLLQHNTKLNENNIDLNGILNTINNLPTKEEAISLQDKTVDPSEETQIIKADEGYDGLNEVTINPATGGGKYTPRWITFYQYRGEDLIEELNQLDTSKLTNLSSMFEGCYYLKQADLSHFDTTNVTKMDNTFNSCRGLTTLDFSSFNTSNLTSMQNTFNNCEKIQTLDFSSFNTEKLTSLNAVFKNCYALTSVNLKSFNTSKVTIFYSLFNNCRSLTELDLSNFVSPAVTNMGYMFAGCKVLTKLDIRGFTFGKVTSHSDMFKDIPANCEIIVKDDTAREWVLARRSDLTNVKTVAEL